MQDTDYTLRPGRVKHSAAPEADYSRDAAIRGYGVWSTFHNHRDVPEGSTILRYYTPDPAEAIRFADQEVARIKAFGIHGYDHVYVADDCPALKGPSSRKLICRWYADVPETIEPDRITLD